MSNIKPWVVVLVAFAEFTWTGCAMGPVTKGTLIGAASGAALGAGTGVLISDPDLLGSSDSPETANISLDGGPSVAAGALIGLVFGGIVGAMIGHGYQDEVSEEKPAPDSKAHASPRPVAF